MDILNISLLLLSTILILLLLSGKQFSKDRNDDGMESYEKEHYRRGRDYGGWQGPGWGRRRNWLW